MGGRAYHLWASWLVGTEALASTMCSLFVYTVRWPSIFDVKSSADGRHRNALPRQVFPVPSGPSQLNQSASSLYGYLDDACDRRPQNRDEECVLEYPISVIALKEYRCLKYFHYSLMLGVLAVRPLAAGREILATYRAEFVHNTRPTPSVFSQRTTGRLLH